MLNCCVYKFEHFHKDLLWNPGICISTDNSFFEIEPRGRKKGKFGYIFQLEPLKLGVPIQFGQ